VVQQLSGGEEGRNEQGLWQTICRWFRGTFPLGAACIPLLPLLPSPAGVEEFLHALAELPLADFLRIVVTISPTNPETPLDAETLLSLRTDRFKARAFTYDHLRFTGKQRTHLLQVLADPETARAELVEMLHRYHERIYAQVEPHLWQERFQAAERLHELLREQPTPLPDWLSRAYDIQGFSPVVLAPSVLRDVGVRSYIHEVRRSLFDRLDYALIKRFANRRAVGSLTTTMAPPSGKRSWRASQYSLLPRWYREPRILPTHCQHKALFTIGRPIWKNKYWQRSSSCTEHAVI
jgi:hypothetical protein